MENSKGMEGERETKAEFDPLEIEYVSYGGEHHLPLIMNLVDQELSEPYSIFTYRYFVYLWPQLSFLAFHKGKCAGTVVCRIGGSIGIQHLGAILLCWWLSNPIEDKELVKLEAEVTNKGALALYGRFGFIRAKRIFCYYLNGVDAFCLKMLFPQPAYPPSMHMMTDRDLACNNHVPEEEHSENQHVVC